MSLKSKNSEFDHFSTLANDWWSKNGKFKILHDIQPIRIKYIQEALNKNRFNNMIILDIGCGGGLISEGVSKLGANVYGFKRGNLEWKQRRSYSFRSKKYKVNYG